jgi:hypothetical protein
MLYAKAMDPRVTPVVGAASCQANRNGALSVAATEIAAAAITAAEIAIGEVAGVVV